MGAILCSGPVSTRDASVAAAWDIWPRARLAMKTLVSADALVVVQNVLITTQCLGCTCSIDLEQNLKRESVFHQIAAGAPHKHTLSAM